MICCDINPTAKCLRCERRYCDPCLRALYGKGNIEGDGYVYCYCGGTGLRRWYDYDNDKEVPLPF